MNIGKRRGFTLTELMIALSVSVMVIFAIISVYLQGYSMLRKGTVQTWAQHQANFAVEQIVDIIRPARNINLYSAYSASPVIANGYGNYVRAYGYGYTAGVYRSGSTLYYIPDTTADNKNTSTDDVVLASNIMQNSPFILSNFNLNVSISIYDPQEPNTILIDLQTSVKPRNL